MPFISKLGQSLAFFFYQYNTCRASACFKKINFKLSAGYGTLDSALNDIQIYEFLFQNHRSLQRNYELRKIATEGKKKYLHQNQEKEHADHGATK
jgi:hypothetical protein